MTLFFYADRRVCPLQHSLTDDLERDDSCCHADVEGIDVARHRDDKMIVDTFQVSLADAVFFRTHHDSDRTSEVSLPDCLFAFFRKRNHFQAASLQKINGIFDIFDTAHIN